MKTKLAFMFALAVMLAMACSKDKDEETVREQLSGKNWKITQAGLDANANGIPDGSELQPADSNFYITGILNESGTGSLTFHLADTSGTASFTWTLDASNTYITSTVPALSQTIVSKLLNVNSNNFSLVVDTSASTKLFAYFERQ